MSQLPNVGPRFAPTRPYGLAATAVSSGVLLTWFNGEQFNITGNAIERSTNGVNFTQIAAPDPTATSWTDVTALAGVTYFYRVRSYNYGIGSQYTDAAALTTPAAPAPLAPLTVAQLLGWWRGDQCYSDFGVTKCVEGGPIVQQNDLGPFANHLVQPTATTRLVWRGGVVNGFPGVQLGSTFSLLTTLPLVLTPPWTVYAVQAHNLATRQNSNMPLLGNRTFSNPLLYNFWTSSNTFGVEFTNDAGTDQNKTIANANAPLRVPQLVRYRCNSAGICSYFASGFTEQSATVVYSGTFTFNQIYACDAQSLSGNFNKVCDLIVYGDDLPTNNVAGDLAIRNYINQRYALTIP